MGIRVAAEEIYFQGVAMHDAKAGQLVALNFRVCPVCRSDRLISYSATRSNSRIVITRVCSCGYAGTLMIEGAPITDSKPAALRS